MTKIGEGEGLPNARKLIFDAVRETVIKVVPEGTFSVTLDLRSNSIELHDILIDLLPVFHGEVVELVFSISDGSCGPKLVWSSGSAHPRGCARCLFLHQSH